jgi:hypothetical protein
MLPVVAVVGVVAIAGGGGRLEMVACSTRQQLVEEDFYKKGRFSSVQTVHYPVQPLNEKIRTEKKCHHLTLTYLKFSLVKRFKLTEKLMAAKKIKVIFCNSIFLVWRIRIN